MSDEPSQGPSASASRTGLRRRQETSFIGVLRRFSRLWGFLIFAFVVVFMFRGIVLPFVFAMLMAYLLAPIIARMQPKLGRVLSVITIYLVILGLIGVFFGLLLPNVFEDLFRLRDSLPDAFDKVDKEYLPRVSVWLQDTFGSFVSSSPPPDAADVPNELIITPLGDGS